MKRLGVILASICFSIMLASAAQAIVYPPLKAPYNSLFFTNSEVFVNNVGAAANVVDVGDQFYGILFANTLAGDADSAGDGPDFINAWFPNNTPAEITGYFALEVKNIFYDAGSNITFFLYGPTTDPNQILGAGEVIRIYTDDVLNYDDTTRTSGISTATDGDHVWTLGFNYDEPFLTGIGDTLDADGYFYATVVGNNTTIDANTGTTNTYLGANFSKFNPNAFTVPICDPDELLYNTACVGDISLDTGLLVDMWANAEISIRQTPDGVGDVGNKSWDIFSNDPAVLYPKVIPEPTSMLLLGTGLVGLAGGVRRRRKAAKK